MRRRIEINQQRKTVLWMHLKDAVSGYKFRRQHPIGMYIADFYCHKAKLIIEIDGSIHQQEAVKQNDEEKEAYLANLGYSILRFTNEEVMINRNEVLLKIKTVLNINTHKNTPNG